MGMTNDGLSYWQAETAGIDLLEMTIRDLLDCRAEEFPLQEAVVYSYDPEFDGNREPCVQRYPIPVFYSVAWWVPKLFGAAAVDTGYSHPLADQLLQHIRLTRGQNYEKP